MKPNDYLKAPLSNVTTLHLKHGTTRMGFPKLLMFTKKFQVIPLHLQGQSDFNPEDGNSALHM